MSDGTVAVVDIDGTLVDSNYHHALAWYRALRGAGLTVPLWRIHRSIGMGGDKLVAALAGEEAERILGDDLRARQGELFGAMIGEVAPLPGAREAVTALAGRARAVILASSARGEEAEHYVGLLGIGDVVDGWTTSADVDATKPDPELVTVAMGMGGGAPAVMIGDATWDVFAAARAGIPAHCVLTGGFGRDELYAAGAASIHAILAELTAAVLPLL